MRATEPQPHAPSLFETMRAQIEATPLPAMNRDRLRPGSWFAGRPRLAVGSVLASILVVVAVALGLGLVAGTAPPAYAVTDNGDGTVTVTLKELQALPALNARLAADGVAVRAVPMRAGCDARASVVVDGRASAPETPEAPPIGNATITMNPDSGEVVSLTVRPPTAASQTLVIAASSDGRLIAGQVVQGAVPGCVGESTSAP